MRYGDASWNSGKCCTTVQIVYVVEPLRDEDVVLQHSDVVQPLRLMGLERESSGESLYRIACCSQAPVAQPHHDGVTTQKAAALGVGRARPHNVDVEVPKSCHGSSVDALHFAALPDELLVVGLPQHVRRDVSAHSNDDLGTDMNVGIVAFRNV